MATQATKGLGFFGPFISWLTPYILDKTAKPVYDWLLRQGYITIKGKEIKKEVKKVKEATDEDTWDSAADDL